ncbi:MAG: hypothetical protein GY722_14105 [bacterium]|nr:hypothetical protein [bacterium]
MQKLRSAVADLLVGVVVIVVALWLLRGVLRMVLWGVNLVILVLVIGLVLRIASKIRG